jgi:hypothetical protein
MIEEREGEGEGYWEREMLGDGMAEEREGVKKERKGECKRGRRQRARQRERDRDRDRAL